MRTAPSFVPLAPLYAGLAYQPPAADALTREVGMVVGTFLRGGEKART